MRTADKEASAMRAIDLIVMFAALSTPSSAPKHSPVPAKAASQAASSQAASAPANAGDREKLHASAMKFIEASDTRQRLAQNLDKLLEDGKQSILRKSPGLNPLFGEEWVKRMRSRVNLDQFVVATAQVYEKYFTSDELDELAAGQLALKKGQIQTLPQALADKLKTNSPFIQRDINTETSIIGGRLSAEVGKEIEKDHPEWAKPTAPAAPVAKKL
jgi:hypothetical protein